MVFCDLKSSDFIIEQDYCFDLLLKVHKVSIEYRESSFDMLYFYSCGISFPEDIYCSVNKRKSDFLAGRYAAKLALLETGYKEFQVAVGSNRAPVWPEDLLGTISHSGPRAICYITKKEDNNFIGADVEYWLSDDIALELCNNIVSKDELKYMEGIGLPIGEGITIVFSAKESLFKALYPKVKKYFDFEAAVIIELDLMSKSFVLELVSDLPGGAYCIGDKFTGRYYDDSEFVETLIIG